MDLIGKLIEKGFLDEEKAASIRSEAESSGRALEEVLLEENVISQEELFDTKSEVIDVPFKKEIDFQEIDSNLISLIHKDSIDQYKMAPIGKEGDKVQIGMVYPEDLRAKEALKFISRKEGITYDIYLITPALLEEIKKNHNPSAKTSTSSLMQKLVKEGVLEDKEAREIEKEAEERKKRKEEVLLEKEIISEGDLFGIKSEVVDVPLKKEIDVKSISQETLDLVDGEVANYYKMAPIGKEGDKVQIGMVYPEDLRAQEALRLISRKNIFSYKVLLITPTTFQKIKERYHAEKKKLSKSLLERLVEKGYLEKDKAENLAKEAENRGITRERILLQEKIISEGDLFETKSEIVGVPLKKKVNVEGVPEDIRDLFSKEAAKQYKMAPIGKEGDKVQIGMVYPEDERSRSALDITAEKKKFSYKLYLITLSDFKKVSEKQHSSGRDLESPLMERLIREGVISKEEAEKTEEEAGRTNKTREEVLLEKKMISEEDLFNFKEEVFGFSFKTDFSPEKIDDDLLRLVPEDSANYYKMAPIGKEGDKVQIGMVYPEDLRAQEALKFLARRDSLSYEIYLISLSAFNTISKQYRTLTKEVGAALEDLDEMEFEEGEEEKLDMDMDVSRLAEEAPIVKVVAVVLRNAIEGGASDIHIEPTREKLKIRFRVDGILYSSLYLPLSVHLATVARIKILAGLKIDEQRLPQDGRFSTKVREKNVDFRVSTFPTTLGEKVVVRVLDPTEGIKTIEELGITEKNFQILKRSIKKPTGLTLVTGPTGSGKTTTLYSLMKILNEERVNIVTLEDPVEYFMDGINQSQVNSEIGYVFAKGLRQVLRQDPDVIMVGEIRDDETADLATHAALTGHVVLSTLHTNDATGVVPRLIDMGIKPFLIPSSLNMAMSQRLVRKLCDKCKKEVEPSEDIRLMIEEELEKIPAVVKEDLNIPSPLKIYKADGCKHCSEEGVVGRMGIFEVLSMTQELGEIILKNPTDKEIKEEAFRQGMITLKQDGMLKVVQGRTTIEEVIRATEET